MAALGPLNETAMHLAAYFGAEETASGVGSRATISSERIKTKKRMCIEGSVGADHQGGYADVFIPDFDQARNFFLVALVNRSDLRT